MTLLERVCFHIVENKEQHIFHGREGTIFIGAIGSILTRLAFKGKQRDIGLESNPKKRQQGSKFIHGVAGESEESSGILDEVDIA